MRIMDRNDPPTCEGRAAWQRRPAWKHPRPGSTSLQIVCWSVVVAVASATPGGAQPVATDERTPAPAAAAWLEAELDQLVELYTQLHQAPELSLAEERTAARMAAELRSVGAEVTVAVGGHGVVGLLSSGPADGPVLMLRADMDALPIVERTGLPYASTVRVQDDRGARVRPRRAHDRPDRSRAVPGRPS